jgi:hypothetical protein
MSLSGRSHQGCLERPVFPKPDAYLRHEAEIADPRLAAIEGSFALAAARELPH